MSSGKPDPDIQLALTDESDIFTWKAQLRGPSGTPYARGVFELSIKCPSTYPLAPPKVSFVTPIFHPNVLFKTGEPADSAVCARGCALSAVVANAPRNPITVGTHSPCCHSHTASVAGLAHGA